MSVRRKTPLPGVAVTIALLLPRAAACAEEPLRYRLDPGTRLVYEGEEVAVTASSRLGLERRSELLVVRERGEGVWDVIVTHHQVRFIERGGGREAQPESGSLQAFEVRADGTIVDRALDTSGTIDRLLPRLPADESELRAGWTFTSGDVLHHCRTAPGGGSGDTGHGALSCFEIEPTSDLTDLQEFSATYRYDFDRVAGLIRAIHVQHRHQGRDTRSGTDRLIERARLDEEAARALAADYDAWLLADRAYVRTVADALSSRTPHDARALLERARESLDGTRDTMHSAILRAHLERRLEEHDQAQPSIARSIAQQSALIGRPAPGWSLLDMAGGGHDLMDYRGRIVLLDFWHRHCGFCIRAMPQLREVARRFTAERVVVLGMNVDERESDARLVIDKLGIDYPTLRADRSVAAAYGVRGYPTVFVIDGRGDVRSIIVGHSPQLAQDLIALIQGLLPD
jgi:thiol-disulfide isomerase/thioredoxin